VGRFCHALTRHKKPVAMIVDKCRRRRRPSLVRHRAFRTGPLLVEPTGLAPLRGGSFATVGHRSVALSASFFRLRHGRGFSTCGLLVRCGWVARLGSTPARSRQIVVKPPPRKPPFVWRVERIMAKGQPRTGMCIARRPTQIKAGPVDPLAEVVGRRGLVLRFFLRSRLSDMIGLCGGYRRRGWLLIFLHVFDPSDISCFATCPRAGQRDADQRNRRFHWSLAGPNVRCITKPSTRGRMKISDATVIP